MRRTKGAEGPDVPTPHWTALGTERGAGGPGARASFGSPAQARLLSQRLLYARLLSLPLFSLVRLSTRLCAHILGLARSSHAHTLSLSLFIICAPRALLLAALPVSYTHLTLPTIYSV